MRAATSPPRRRPTRPSASLPTGAPSTVTRCDRAPLHSGPTPPDDLLSGVPPRPRPLQVEPSFRALFADEGYAHYRVAMAYLGPRWGVGMLPERQNAPTLDGTSRLASSAILTRARPTARIACRSRVPRPKHVARPDYRAGRAGAAARRDGGAPPPREGQRLRQRQPEGGADTARCGLADALAAPRPSDDARQGATAAVDFIAPSPLS